MKNLFVCVAVVGLAAVGVYGVSKKSKSNTVILQGEEKKVDFATNIQEKEIPQNTGVEEELDHAKREGVQSVYERHSEVGSIMKDAYSNIMEDFMGDLSDKNAMNSKDDNKEVVIDKESVSIMKEMDSISNKLDDLLK